MSQATRGWLQVIGIVCDEWSVTSDVWPIHQCTLDFSISKALSNRSNNCVSQSTWFTPRLLTSEHIFIARLKEYQWINKCQRMMMLTVCDKRPAFHLVLLSQGQSGGAGLQGTRCEFFPFFSAQPVTFSRPFSLLADGEKGSQQVRASNTFLPHI